MSHTYVRSEWATLLPDGDAFCHWGGRAASLRMLSLARPHDTLLDWCCGEGGLLSLADRPSYGIDLSRDAITKARMRSPQHQFTIGDAAATPYGPGSFDTVLAEDPDVFLGHDHEAAFAEAYRILRPGGIFAFHVYATTPSCSLPLQKRIADALASLGYLTTRALHSDTLPHFLTKVGFRDIGRHDWHAIYVDDNERMIDRLPLIADSPDFALYRELLLTERELFATRGWTGVFVSARKPSSVASATRARR